MAAWATRAHRRTSVPWLCVAVVAACSALSPEPKASGPEEKGPGTCPGAGTGHLFPSLPLNGKGFPVNLLL